MPELSPRRAVVTGAGGFIGGRLALRLAAEGWEVSLLRSCEAGTTGLPTGPNLIERRVDFHDAEAIASALRKSGAEIVYHLGAVNVSQHRPEDIGPLFHSNVTLSAMLCDGMARFGIRRIVAIGSAWQHGSGQAFRPICLYASAKQAMQDVFAYYAFCQNMQCTTLKLFHAYGPGDRRERLVSMLCKAARDGATLEMTAGAQIVDFTHVDDVVNALIHAGRRMESEPGGCADSFSIASEAPLTVRQLVALVEEATGRPINVRWCVRPYKPFEFFEPVSLGRRLPGWEPETDLRRGIADLAAAEYSIPSTSEKHS